MIINKGDLVEDCITGERGLVLDMSYKLQVPRFLVLMGSQIEKWFYEFDIILVE